MSQFRAAPYVKALFEVVGRGKAADETVAALDRFAEALRLAPEIERVMVAPTVSPEDKTAILDTILDRLEVSGPARRLVFVVQSHYRLEHFADIAAGFRDRVDRAMGRVHAVVEVASGLDEAGRAQLLATLEGTVGSSVIADFVVSPELLGGFRIQVGSKVFDGSLSGQLQRLGREAQ